MISFFETGENDTVVIKIKSSDFINLTEEFKKQRYIIMTRFLQTIPLFEDKDSSWF